ncbi:heavy metal translocating P-type ATPase [Gemella cuniculi]|uniref:heavy metal translocating P-type ATPase n=1 Tax=Gemella cuniculi TaxID=150240 RepID=UPI0004127BA7|nr:heavy metal translocating P-type ATPase [Gemella cuniculi]
MYFKIVHLSSKRARIRTTIRITPDVRSYFKKQVEKIKEIKKIEFYQDEFTFNIFFNSKSIECIKDFLTKINVSDIKTCYENPTLKKEDSPYTIISNAVFWRAISELILPLPIKAVWTWWKAFGYFKSTTKLLLERKLTMESLDSAAVLVSLLTGQRSTASSIMFILELGEELNNWSEKKSITDLEKSLISEDKDVWILDNGIKKKIKSFEIKEGDVALFSEGNEILFDGIVVGGIGSIDESSLTGESFPISKNINDKVYSNTIVVHGELYVRVENPQINGRIHQLIQLIKESEKKENTYHYKYIQLADRIVKYNFIAMGLTYLLTRSFSKAISFLLVDYSCALKLSTPVAYLTTIKNLIDKKIVVKNSATLDKYAEIDTFVFDKTGTITVSQPYIKEVIPFYEYNYEEVIKIGACLEEHIYHPIANAVVNKAEEDGIEHEEMHTELYHIASKGIISHIDGEKVVIGSLQLLKEENIIITDSQQKIIEEKQEYYNLLFLGYKEKLISIFCVDIPLREEAAYVVKKLRNLGKKVVLLTGDNKFRTQKILNNITFDEVNTSMTPVTKFEYIKKEKEQGKKVLMIGDGLNDSAALSESDISIVMNESADLSKQISDIVLKADNLKSLLMLDEISKNLRNQMKNNVHQTIFINSSLIMFGLTNVVSSNLLAVFHNLTTFGIVLRNFRI